MVGKQFNPVSPQLGVCFTPEDQNSCLRKAKDKAKDKATAKLKTKLKQSLRQS